MPILTRRRLLSFLSLFPALPLWLSQKVAGQESVQKPPRTKVVIPEEAEKRIADALAEASSEGVQLEVPGFSLVAPPPAGLGGGISVHLSFSKKEEREWGLAPNSE